MVVCVDRLGVGVGVAVGAALAGGSCVSLLVPLSFCCRSSSVPSWDVFGLAVCTIGGDVVGTGVGVEEVVVHVGDVVGVPWELVGVMPSGVGDDAGTTVTGWRASS